MNYPITVTFDHNTYESVVSPDKETISDQRDVFRKVNEYIKNGYILPFLSETILTIETLSKEDRQRIFPRTDRVISKIDDKITSKIEIQPNRQLYPEATDHFYKYLPKAIELGFKILPSYRLGKLINPEIKPVFYHTAKKDDPFEVSTRFSSIVDFIEEKGFGFSVLKKRIGFDDNMKQPWFFFLNNYNGSLNKLSEGIAEWSDADSIAIHIAFELDYFCTFDGSGKKMKNNSVFGKEMKHKLRTEYNVEFITPFELIALIEKPLKSDNSKKQ
jgi:hypothetical protein